jgi:hypothetical protein
MSNSDTQNPSQSKRRNRNWVWVFLVLALLGIGAVTINWAVNSAYYVAEPLTPERLRAARELWRNNRPRDYNLKIVKSATYSSSDGTDGTIVDKFELQVRDGKITSFLVNGKDPEPLIAPNGQRNLDEERRQRENYDISGLFDAIEEFMERDKRDHFDSHLRARFDSKDGHVTIFVRDLNGKRVPLIQVELRKPN